MKITEQIMVDLAVLQETAGWKVLCKLIKAREIEGLQEKLTTHIYESMEERDRDVSTFQMMKAIIELPAKYIRNGQSTSNVKNFDPYDVAKKVK